MYNQSKHKEGISMRNHAIPGFGTQRKSRYYMDPTAVNGPVIIKKKADPKLLEKNREQIEKNHESYKRRQQIIEAREAMMIKAHKKEMQQFIVQQ